MKDITFPCNIGDKIYILKEENCLWGHNPFEEGNACIVCNEEECNYGYYIREKIVIGFRINKHGLWIEAENEDCNAYGYKETVIKHPNGLGSEFFFDKTEAKKYIEICNKHLRKKDSK